MSPTRRKPPGAPVSISPATLPDGTVGQAYSQPITATGGNPPYHYYFSGELPPGISLATGGLISGTPTTAGSSSFTISVTDKRSASAHQAYTIAIAAVEQPPEIPPEQPFPLPVGRGQQGYIFERPRLMPITVMGRKYAAAAGPAVGTLVVDGSASGTGSGATTFTFSALTTTMANDLLIAFTWGNAGNYAASLTSTNTTFSLGGGTPWASSSGNCAIFFGKATAPLSGEIITANLANNNTAGGVILAVNGCDLSSYPGSMTSFLDGNVSTPQSGTSGTPGGVATTAAVTMMFAGFRGNGDGSPTLPWHSVLGGTRASLYSDIDYQIFSSAQGSTSIVESMTAINGWVMGAIKASGQ